MFNNAVIGRCTALVALASLAIMPIIARAEALQDVQADDQVSESAAADRGVEGTFVPPRQEARDESASMRAPALRPYDPGRRCGNIMLTWDDPCDYASPMRVSVDAADIRR